MAELVPGARFASTVCTTEVIVVRGPGEADLTCGGAPMAPVGSEPITGEPAADAAEGSLLGKRYTDADDSIELLVTRSGDGSLAASGELLAVAQPKALPASD